MTDCIFCRIAKREIPAAVVAETDSIIAFRDLNPQAPIHVLVVPLEHTASAATTSRELLGTVFQAATEIAKMLGVADTGYRLVTNIGQDGGQSVNHLHVHLLAGRQMLWPPG